MPDGAIEGTQYFTGCSMPGLLAASWMLGAAVVDAIADHRPAVVLALLDDVDLVAAARAVLVLPQLSARRVAAPAPCGLRWP